MSSKPKKQSRKEFLRQEDAFISAATQSASWAQKHRTLVIVAGVALAVLIAAAISVNEYQKSTAKEASKYYFEGLEALSAEIDGGAGDTIPDSVDSPDTKTFASKEEKYEAAIAALTKAEQTTSAGVELMAQLALGDAYAARGNHQEALQIFSQALSSLSRRDALFFVALERVAYAQEEMGDTTAALDTWAKVAQDKSHFYADNALYQQIRILALAGDTAKAKEYLERLKTNHEGSRFVGESETLLGNLDDYGSYLAQNSATAVRGDKAAPSDSNPDPDSDAVVDAKPAGEQAAN